MTTVPFELETEGGTTASGVTAPRSPTQTMASITKNFGLLRDRTTVLDADVGSDHREALLHTLQLLARDRARSDVQTLLIELSTGRGLGWSDIARLVGVSVQALTKWRRGEPATGENRLAVARLAAFLDLLAEVPVQDPAGWLELPVVDGYAARHLDVYLAGRPEILFDLAHLRIDPPERALDELDPGWRQHWQLQHEVFEADDGQLSIRRRR